MTRSSAQSGKSYAGILRTVFTPCFGGLCRFVGGCEASYTPLADRFEEDAKPKTLLFKYGVALLSLLFVLPLFAADYTLKSSATSWQSPDSYVETEGTGSLPPSGSYLVIPKNKTMELASASDFAFLNTMRGVKPLLGSQLNITVAEGTNTLSCVFSIAEVEKGGESGAIHKLGNGTLHLTSDGVIVDQWSQIKDHYAHWFVDAGKVAFCPQTAANKTRLYENINVAEGAVVLLPPVGNATCWQINGLGTIRNDSATTITLKLTSGNGGRSDFGGVITGNLKVSVSGGAIFSGTENLYSGLFQVMGYKAANKYSGIVDIVAFDGKAEGQPTSVGTQGYFDLGQNDSNGSAYLRYIGMTGETVTKTIGYRNGNPGWPFVVDGGLYGGLTFTGPWRNWNNGHSCIVLTGSNTVHECSIGSSVFEATTKDNATVNDQVTKSGPGIWHFTESGTKSGLGLIAVEEGTLRFDTMKDRGIHCSLGFSDMLYENLYGLVDESKRVPYAFRLGGANVESTFEYVGADAVLVATRPLGLSTGISHLASNGAGAFRLRGAGGIAAGAYTLVLDGTNTLENMLSTVSNGVGIVSVVKAGPGAWTLAGEQSWSGTLAVKGGTLNLLPPTSYSYYQWVFKQTVWGCSRYADVIAAKGEEKGAKNVLALGELALYDATGKRQNIGLVDADPVSVLLPGQAKFANGRRPAFEGTSAWGNLTTDLFNGYSYHSEDGKYVANGEFYVKNLDGHNFNLNDDTTWLSISCRLTNATPEITYYDIAYSYGYNQDAWAASTAPTAYSIRGSVDGLYWDELVTENAADVPADKSKWLSDKAGYWNNAIRTVTGNGDCFPLRGKPLEPLPFLSNITGISISGGAKIVAANPVTLPDGIPVTIDASSGKTAIISGLVFGPSGTLKVVNAEKGRQIELPVEFKDDSYVNLTNYDLVINGKANVSYKVMAKDGKLTLMPPGLLLIVK